MCLLAEVHRGKDKHTRANACSRLSQISASNKLSKRRHRLLGTRLKTHREVNVEVETNFRARKSVRVRTALGAEESLPCRANGELATEDEDVVAALPITPERRHRHKRHPHRSRANLQKERSWREIPLNLPLKPPPNLRSFAQGRDLFTNRR